MEIALPRGYYRHEVPKIVTQECENLYPVVQSNLTISEVQLLGRAGLNEETTAGGANDINRGSWTLNGVPYAVQGEALYRIQETIVSGISVFSSIYLGQISGTERVSMADNGTQLMILVPGGDGYVYSSSSGLQLITDASFTANGQPQYVVFIDGYFACSTDSKTWIVSYINDGLTWSALDRGTAESDPDSVVAPIVYNNTIFMTGSITTEGFQNIGGTGFPFQRNGIVLDKGCFAPLSLVKSNNRFFMVGGGKNETPSVWAYDGTEFVKVANSAIDYQLSLLTVEQIEDIYAFSWAVGSQFFIAFSTVNNTFVFNASTNMWHENSSYVYASGAYEKRPWRVSSIVQAYGHTFIFDNLSNIVGTMAHDSAYDYGIPIRFIFSIPPTINGTKSMRVPSIELTAVAEASSEVPDPVVGLEITEDFEVYRDTRIRAIGKVGERTKRTVWYKNGWFPKFLGMRFTFVDAITPKILRLDAEII